MIYPIVTVKTIVISPRKNNNVSILNQSQNYSGTSPDRAEINIDINTKMVVGLWSSEYYLLKELEDLK